ncbi:a-factor receptor [Tulasnella sp. 424]|nr:a-factor receptor [Tulasnella sp. 424]
MSVITTSSFDPTYPTFPVLASIGIVLILLPAYWHFKSGNAGTILYIVWTFVGNLNYMVNAIAWAGNLHSPPWFWCDLSTALIVALNVAIPTSSLLITHRLYSIATIRQVNISRSDSRRAKYYEIALAPRSCANKLHAGVVVQGHRFDIIENIGCWPSIYVTPVTIPLVFLPPILINIVSMVYASLAIRAFLKQRKQFNDVLQSANSGLTIGRYFRLMALAATEIICSLPTSTYVMVTNLQTGFHPWISWADTHFNFNRVEFMPFGWFKSFPRAWILINLSRYMLPVGSFLFFVYLGMSGESGTFYRKQFWRLARLLGFPGPSETSSGASCTGRPGASSPSQLQSLPPFVTSVPITSTNKKETLSRAFYPGGTGSKANSSSDSLSMPPDFEDEKGPGAEPASCSRPGLSLEVHSSVV